MIKKISALFSKILYGFASWIIYLVAKFSYATCKKEFVNKELFDSVAGEDVPVIYACWHGRLYIVPHIRPSQKNVNCIVSNSKDGDVIANVLKRHGFGVIRGSSNKTKKEGVLFTKDKGGMQVIRQGVRDLRKGVSLGITPDGPRGPANKFKVNALNMASLSSAPILTFAFSSTRPIIFNSWDKFMIPKPFSKITVVFGEFFHIDKTASKEDLEECGQRIEDNLNKITLEADEFCGLK